MTSDYIEIGASPCEEPCAQVGMENYDRLANFETHLFKEQLERQFPDGRFGVRRCPHDFGSYYEVWAYYDPEDQVEMDAAYKAESEAWETWQPDIKARLVDHGMKLGYMLTARGWERMLP